MMGEQIDSRAPSAIYLSLLNEELTEVAKVDTTKGILDKLKSLYMAKNVITYLFLKSKFCDYV